MNNNFFGAFSSRPFLFLWLSEIFTQVAVYIFNFYLLLSVFTITKSSTAVAGVVLSFTIPQILFGVMAGIYVDYKDKKSILLATNIIRAALLLPLIFFHDSLFVIYLTTFLFAIVTQFFIPAETPMVPLTVPGKMLLSANALFSMGIYGSILLAYILSGPLLLFFGSTQAIIIIALLLFISSLFISFITYRHVRPERAPVGNVILRAGHELRKVFSFFSYSKTVHHAVFLLALSQALILIISVIAPGYASQVLNIRIEDFPILFIAPAAFGVVIGAALLVRLFHNYNKDKIVSFGLVLSGIAMLALPYGSKLASRDIVQSINQSLPGILNITSIHLIVLTAFILGFANALVFVPSNTTLQQHTTDEERGKIYGMLNTIVGILSLLPIILVGGLSDLIGVTKVILGIGIGLILIGFAKIVTHF